MIWGDKKLKERLILNKDDIAHIPQAKISQINPASINIRLGRTFLLDDPDNDVELGKPIKYKQVELSRNAGIYIEPGDFMLATTMEYIHVPNDAAAFVQGRSSIGRIGLTVQNAGYIDPGFYGQITLELKNEAKHRILLWPGYPVAQLVFMDCTDVERPYRGKYLGQVGATGSRMHMDNFFKKKG